MNEVNTIPKKYSNIDGLRTFGCLAIVAWPVSYTHLHQVQ